jgi:hypothetical protein
MELTFKDRLILANKLTEVEAAIAHLRLSPQAQDEHLEELRQQYETVLSLLESHFLGALVSGNWKEFDQFVNDFRTSRIR